MGLVLGPVVALTAHAQVYMSERAAVGKIFPGDQLERSTLRLTDDLRTSIEAASGQKFSGKILVIWKDAKTRNCVLVDQVYGKHEFITYAVGLRADGTVKGLEILEYREAYGHEVRGEKWREQFTGKSKESPLKIDQDIKNLSGATMSSAHLTEGVRKLLFTYDAVKSQI
ncbi:MAG: FMN-binding protein [Bdellovibrio sp.]|nr:MAG: FMN-binding protein [Bdellovibrio sp.]